MPTTPQSQMALAHDAAFLDRLQYLLCQVAVEVKNESGSVTGHAARAAFAGSVIAEPADHASQLAVTIVGATNLIVRDTTIGFDGKVTTSATDAEIKSQLATLWDSFAGVL